MSSSEISDSQKEKEKIASAFERIGRSLKKYFKPIHTALPHLPNHPKKEVRLVEKPQTKSGGVAKVFTLFDKNKHKVKSTPDSQTDTSQELAEIKFTPLENKKPNWLELVSYLLQVCKRAAHKMNVRAGLKAYQVSMGKKAESRVRTVGAIIDARSKAIDLEGEKENKEAA